MGISTHKIYVKHNLTDEQIFNIDRIIVDEYNFKHGYDYIEYHQLYKECMSGKENKPRDITNSDDSRKKLNLEIIKLGEVYARVYAENLSMEDTFNDSINLAGYDFKDWILPSLNSNRFVEVSTGNFSIILSSRKDIMSINCGTRSIGLFHLHKEYSRYQAMRKLSYGIAKVFDSSKDYKAIYINDESVDQDVFESINEGFDNFKSFDELYNDALKFDYIYGFNPPTEEEWSKNNNLDHICPIIIDDFRDFKELEKI